MCETLGYTREELLALSVMDIDVTATREETAKAASRLAPGVPGRAERVLRRKDGSTCPIELSLSRVVVGERQLLLGLARDITDRKRMEEAQADAQRALEERVRERTRHLEEANRRLEEEVRARERSEAALRESEERFRALAERGHLLAWEADTVSWRFVYVGPQARDLLGYPVADWYREDFWIDHIHPEDRERVMAYCRAQSAVAHDYEIEYRMVAADGRTVWLQDIVHVNRDREGAGATVRGFLIDVSARKRAEEAQRLLLRELDHRVKNTLSTVQAVADMTLRTAASLAGFGETFRARLAALARMHGSIWRSSGGPVRLRDLVELSLAPFGHDGERAAIEGDQVLVPARSVAALGLVLHELATNAVKHGALSVPAGRVRVAWRCDGDLLRIVWRESGGPTVVVPSRRGFGSLLIERCIPYELGGSTALDFAPSGVRCTITLSMREPERPADAPVSRSG
jgi:PAS domain S-box-containing protein